MHTSQGQSLALRSAFIQEFTEYVNELSKGKDGIELAIQKRAELIKTLKNQPANDDQLEQLLLVARASEFLRELQGKETLFKVHLDTTIDLFQDWRAGRHQMEHTKALSSEVLDYMDYAKKLLQTVLWFLIDTDAYPDIKSVEESLLYEKSRKIKADDPEYNDSNFLFHSFMKLFEENGTSPDDLLRIYLKIRYRQDA